MLIDKRNYGGRLSTGKGKAPVIHNFNFAVVKPVVVLNTLDMGTSSMAILEGKELRTQLDKCQSTTDIDQCSPLLFLTKGQPVTHFSPLALKISRRLAMLKPARPKPQFIERLQLSIAKEVLIRTKRPAYLSGYTAALYYGWDVLDPKLIVDLQMQDGKKNRRTYVGKHPAWKFRVQRHRWSLPRCAYWQGRNSGPNALPVLAPEYVIVELLALPNLPQALVTVESALRHLLHPDPRQRAETNARWDKLKHRLELIIRKRINPRGRERAWERLKLVSPWSASPGETLLRLASIQAGLPTPISQYPVIHSYGQYFLDLAWPDLQVAFEFDGAIKYQGTDGREALLKEKEREDYLRNFFPIFRRFTWKDLVAQNQTWLRALLQKTFRPTGIPIDESLIHQPACY